MTGRSSTLGSSGGSGNFAKGAMLAAAEHLARWVERNRGHGAEIDRECDRARVAHDLSASMRCEPLVS